MPATEQTWRNQKTMHVVFGGTTLVMVFATLLMLAKDHLREWKTFQLTNRHKEAWVLQARHDQLDDEYSTRMKTYEAELQEAQTEPIEPEWIANFKSLVEVEQTRRTEAGFDDAIASFDDLDSAVEHYQSTSEAVAVARKTVTDLGDAPSDQSVKDLELAVTRAIDSRKQVLAELDEFIDQAKRREKEIVGKRKFVAADRTAAVSERGLKVAHGGTEAEIDEVQKRIDEYSERIAELTEQIALANRYRTDLEAIRGRIDGRRAAIAKENSALVTELDRLEEQASKNSWNVGEWITRWPVLNALYDGNVRINQIWLPDLTINYNFSQVARFDRCKTCHQAINQTAAGTATDPAYPTIPKRDRRRVVQLETPTEAPANDSTLRDVYGFLVGAGIFDYADVTVKYVLPETPAARAGLESGDVITHVGDLPVYDAATVENQLLKLASWGELTSLTVRRGFDHPYTTHPRLDLYLTDASPHPEKVVGCTVCHDGQGSGTEFLWTSHTPDNAEQQNEWAREYDWFNNHHWIFPMKPARFVESNCLKCHHEKGGLEPSEEFPEPPAPKLVEGWTLVEKYGCFGCHEINGFDGPDKRIGPDLRLEPNYSEVATQILTDGSLSDQQRSLAAALVDQPDDDAARHLLFQVIKQDAQLASQTDTRPEAQLIAATHKLADGLKDVEAPGSYRKVGPSLRYLNSKVDFDWVYSWIKQPSNFRPSTRMPRFFGQVEHLQEDPAELAEAERFEPVEIHALSEYLLANSAEFQYLEPAEGVTEAPSAERGKWLFESRGCLACHSHESFPGIASNQGPDLSRVAAKLSTDKGQRWLYSWIKEPHKYHVRTKMPVLFLDPIAETDPTGQPTGVVTDPAADIAAFLLGEAVDWQPNDAPAREWSADEQAALADLAVEWLSSDLIPRSRAEAFVKTGIPAKLEPKLKADEKLLLEGTMTPANRTAQLQDFVARRTIGKYGCFGCHDIPGFEDAKPIGTGLADWGRKETSKLAFENIHKFLEGPGHPDAGHDAEDPHLTEEHVAHGHLDPTDFDADTSYYIQSLNSHERDGFIWQKLRMPRSYDYKTTKNKGYNERLRMPRFPFTPEEREAVITFVLGLVNEAPAEKFVYQPGPRQQAIVEGRRVLEQFNCAGCHTLKMEQWEFDFDPEMLDSPSTIVDYPFLEKHPSRAEISASEITDERGLMHASLKGLPVINQQTGQAQRVDEDGLELLPEDEGELDPYYLFTLWQDTLLGGEPWLVGVQDVMVPANRDGYGPARGTAYPAWGGDLTRYLFPKVIAKAQETNPQAKGGEAWGWLPPPLMVEGEKVQSDWLHGFLMDPTLLRPAVVMRMPNFKMSSDEAAKLVDFFAAYSGAEYPFEYRSRQRASYLAEQESTRPDRLQEALNIVVDGNYCVKCHSVEDFHPQGDPTTFGPDLANVHDRLRPEYVRDWVANPKRILPYTGMPVNVPYNPDAENLGGVAQTLYHGTSLEQLDGLVDLLMNFDTYAKRRTEITPMVQAAQQNAAPAAENPNAADAAQR